MESDHYGDTTHNTNNYNNIYNIHYNYSNPTERLKLKKQLVLLRRRGRKILLFRSKQEPPRAPELLKIPKNLFSTRSIGQYCFFVLLFSLAHTRVYFSLRFITSFNCQAKSIEPSGGADSAGHFSQGEKKNLNRFNSFR